MKAIIITKPGGSEVLNFEEKPTPIPNKNEVLISIKAAGLNRSDVAQRKGKYPAPKDAPQDILGLEVSGIIEACGEDVKRWKKGDKVVALLSGGGYAQFVTVDAGSCLPIPKNLSFVEAASLPETVFTVWNNIFQRGALKSGENFLVHGGSSGIGITAIQIAKALGAKVFATAGSDEKCEACKNLGADICINYKDENFEDILKNEGVDVILDMIGGDYVEKNINILNPDGRMVFINAMKGNPKELNIMKMMQKRIMITGSTLRSRDLDFKSALAKEVEKHVWPLVEQGKFKPIIHQVFPLKEAGKAQELMESSEHIGKIILSNE
ncbi:zinc-binding dehydrogenase [Pedobacter psychrophilus]|uniref:Zinc-binding dehydrogenase n=1 Tax=Pedobacter psychrophilus TaxID=1826909 RepID=A0A179DDP6_9SPHI|nr:NAD(P)H-quinone oxidoreductase [Pedobacter psychrophilus]OAQ38639.1 zinc-binding dehydrogenase [Pedobacter psychrophilus]